MKKIVCLVAILSLCLIVICGCENAQETSSDSASKQATSSKDWVYEVPVNVVQIDLTAEDPSNDAMKFVYDDMGRVSQCYYKIDGTEIYINYEYTDNQVHIYGFSGSIVAAEENFTLPSFDKSVGFSAYNGYYFKGYNFE